MCAERSINFITDHGKGLRERMTYLPYHCHYSEKGKERTFSSARTLNSRQTIRKLFLAYESIT